MKYKRLYTQKYNWTHKLPWIGIMGVATCLFLQVFISNRYAVSGGLINTVDTDIKLLTDENNGLREKIASASSTLALSEKAVQLGFVKRISPDFLTADLPVAAGL